MPRGRKPGRPKGSKNVKTFQPPIQAAATKVAATRRRSNIAIGAQTSLGTAFSTILNTLESIPSGQRPKIMQAINVFIGG